jgi:hypothetical protein
MSRYDSVPKREAATDDKPKEREMCGVPDCTSHYVPNGNPQRRRGFADVAFTLPDGTRIARCAEHYCKDIYRAGNGSWSDITGRDLYLTQDALDAHYKQMGARELVI